MQFTLPNITILAAQLYISIIYRGRQRELYLPGENRKSQLESCGKVGEIKNSELSAAALQ
jgi:hypothetical protein